MARLRAPLVVACTLVMALGGAACSRELSNTRPNDRKVLFVAIDGLDFEMLKPWMRDGRMPRLSELVRRGMAVALFGEHSTMDPASAGVDPARSWTTIATGAPPSRSNADKGAAHGITELMTRVRGSYLEVPVTSQHRRLPAMWDVLSAAGVRCAIVNWWTTWPAEPVNGYVVSDRFLLDRFELGPFGPAGRPDLPPVDPSYRHGAKYLTWPEALGDELAAQLKAQHDRPAHPIFPRVRDWLTMASDAGTHADLLSLRQALMTDWLAKESTVALLRRDPRIRFCACYLDSLDVAHHLFWIDLDAQRWLSSTDPATRQKVPPDFRNFATVIPEVTSAVDAMLGELVDAMGKEAVVVLASDHSLIPDADRSNRDFNMNRLLERTGLLVRDAQGGIDWSRTKVFDHADWPARFERQLSLNFEGDWPQGFLKGGTAEERNAVREQIRAQLNALKVDRRWKDPNGRLFDSLFWGSDVVGWDLTFAVYQSFAADAKVRLSDGDVPLSQLFPSRRTSCKHVDPGVLFVAWPGAAGEKLAARQPPLGKDAAASVHVAPFVLSLFGIPRSADEDESSSSADTLYWLLERDEAHRIAIGRVGSYAEALRRDDPKSELGARRAEFKRYVGDELGGFGPPPPPIAPPKSPGPRPSAPVPK
jgi:predicted AlkP superfamily phosphohydrolase/phosphomutase